MPGGSNLGAEKGSPDWSALSRAWGTGSFPPPPAPGLQSPQVAEGRGGGVSTVTRPPLQENAVSRALHQQLGGASAADRFLAAQRPELCPAGKPRKPERGWDARRFIWGDPSLPRAGPLAHPGRFSDITLKPLSYPRIGS